MNRFAVARSRKGLGREHTAVPAGRWYEAESRASLHGDSSPEKPKKKARPTLSGVCRGAEREPVA